MAEIEQECPGCDVKLLRTYEDGSALILFTPPEEDRALNKVTSDDWGRVTSPVQLFVPAATVSASRLN